MWRSLKLARVTPSTFRYISPIRAIAAATIAVAGILHLAISSSNIITDQLNFRMFFLEVGISQLFWVLPIILTTRRGRIWWYSAAVGETLALIVLWVITRLPLNNLVGKAFPINTIGVAVEILDAAFLAMMITLMTRQEKQEEKITEENKSTFH